MSIKKEENMHSDQMIKSLGIAAMALCVMWPMSLSAKDDGSVEDQKAQEFTGPLQDQLEEYWSVDRELPMIKERLFEMDGRFSAGVHVGVIPSEPFYVYVPVGARVGYFFSNELAVEVSGQYMISRPTQLNGFLTDERAGGFSSDVDTEDQFIWNADAVISWHPLYGKWALLQRKLSHLDISFVLGAGALGMNRPDANRAAAETSVQPALVVGAGFGFFVGEKSMIRLDWRSRPYVGPEFETAQFEEQTFLDRVQVPTEFTLGFSYLF